MACAVCTEIPGEGDTLEVRDPGEGCTLGGGICPRREVLWRRCPGEENTQGREIHQEEDTLWREIFWEKYPEEGNSLVREIS